MMNVVPTRRGDPEGREKVRAQRGVEARETVLRAEHEMDDEEALGLRHGGRSMGRAFSPSPGFFAHHHLGRWPRLVSVAPLALIAKTTMTVD